MMFRYCVEISNDDNIFLLSNEYKYREMDFGNMKKKNHPLPLVSKVSHWVVPSCSRNLSWSTEAGAPERNSTQYLVGLCICSCARDTHTHIRRTQTFDVIRRRARGRIHTIEDARRLNKTSTEEESSASTTMSSTGDDGFATIDCMQI